MTNPPKTPVRGSDTYEKDVIAWLKWIDESANKINKKPH